MKKDVRNVGNLLGTEIKPNKDSTNYAINRRESIRIPAPRLEIFWAQKLNPIKIPPITPSTGAKVSGYQHHVTTPPFCTSAPSTISPNSSFDAPTNGRPRSTEEQAACYSTCITTCRMRTRRIRHRRSRIAGSAGCAERRSPVFESAVSQWARSDWPAASTPSAATAERRSPVFESAVSQWARSDWPAASTPSAATS
ncbi:hypothetical protein QE152_g32164 [Popillia japonica]|uniref:Uncharacterized protein n=1 Tax=Popillia japonica TaxID=7064 RepID=A0AAW1J0P8_POPJA